MKRPPRVETDDVTPREGLVGAYVQRRTAAKDAHPQGDGMQPDADLDADQTDEGDELDQAAQQADQNVLGHTLPQKRS
jgi:hypothetical protein